MGDMFTQLRNAIHAYEEYAAKLRTHCQGSSVSPRLMKALSYLYLDIIEFCGDTCRLLSSKKGTSDDDMYMRCANPEPKKDSKSLFSGNFVGSRLTCDLAVFLSESGSICSSLNWRCHCHI